VERRAESSFAGELGAAKINLRPPGLRVAASAEQGWGSGKSIDFQAFLNIVCIITDSHNNFFITSQI
jgi:hypothetical protein